MSTIVVKVIIHLEKSRRQLADFVYDYMNLSLFHNAKVGKYEYCRQVS